MENLIDMDTSYAMPFCRLNVSEYCDTIAILMSRRNRWSVRAAKSNWDFHAF